MFRVVGRGKKICSDPDCESCRQSDLRLNLDARYIDRKNDIKLSIGIKSLSTITVRQFTEDILDFLFLDDISPEDVRLVGFEHGDDYRHINTTRTNISLEQLNIVDGCIIDFEPTSDAPPLKLCRLNIIGPDEVEKKEYQWYRAKTTLGMLFQFVVEAFSLQSVEPETIHLLTVYDELPFLTYPDRRVSTFNLYDRMAVYVQIISPPSSEMIDTNKYIYIECVSDQSKFCFNIENTKTLVDLKAEIQNRVKDYRITHLTLHDEKNESLELEDSNRSLRSFDIQPGETIFATFRLLNRSTQSAVENNPEEESNFVTVKKPKPNNVTIICQYPSQNPETFQIAVTKTIKDLVDDIKRRFHRQRLEISTMDFKDTTIDFKKEEERCLADLGMKNEDRINVTIIEKPPVHKSIVSQEPRESPTTDKPSKSRRGKDIPLGLDNLGNSCYMNSALQCIARIPAFTKFFFEGFRNAHANDGENTNDDYNPFDEVGDVTGAYADLLWSLMRCSADNDDDDDDEYSLKPTRMKEQLGRKDPRFATNDQQDVQEFMTFFLNIIHEELKAKNGNRRNTVINEIFFGKLTSTITCTECNQEESTTNPISFLSISLDRHERRFYIYFIPKQGEEQFLSVCLPINARIENVIDLLSQKFNRPELYYHILPMLGDGEIDMKTSLHEIFTNELIFMEHEDRLRNTRPEPLIAPQKKSTLQDCLAQFFSPEELQDSWTCSQGKCKKKTLAIKQLKLSNLPTVLIIQFKRFIHANGLHQKVETLVDYPLTGLDLKQCLPSLQESAIYDLVGVSAHLGSISGGHYIAYAKHTTRNRSEWYKFDDSYVSRISPNDYQSKIISRNAYLLFYVKRQTETLV